MIAYRDIPTPSFLVDKKQCEHNAESMLQKAKTWGVRLRPHVKTHKSVEIAQFQCDESRAITVSTLAEVIHFFKAGFTNQTYAIPVTLQKIKQLAAQLDVSEMHFLTDNLEQMQEIGNWANQQEITLNFFIKLDVGAARAGVQPKSLRLLELATFIYEHKFLNFSGLLTHAGQSYHTSNESAKRTIAQSEVIQLVQSAEWLESQEIPVKERSIGSTPTMVWADSLEGVTEIRPGNYIFYDVFQYNRGNCELTDIACSVLTSVIGVYPERNTILVDAGALALSKDAGYWESEVRYGLVKHRVDLHIVGLSQEHGVIKGSSDGIGSIKVGDKLEILPNHSCLTAACFPHFHLIEDGKWMKTLSPAKFW